MPTNSHHLCVDEKNDQWLLYNLYTEQSKPVLFYKDTVHGRVCWAPLGVPLLEELTQKI